MPNAFGHDGQLAGPQDEVAPFAVETNRAAVGQEQLVLIQVAMVRHRPLAEKDAQHDIVDLGQVDHSERLSQPGAVLGDVYDL